LARLARNPVVAGSSVALAGLVLALALGLGRGLPTPEPPSPPPRTPALAVAVLSPSVNALFRPKGKGAAIKPKKRAKRATTRRHRG
jgi:hypothetical protein